MAHGSAALHGNPALGTCAGLGACSAAHPADGSGLKPRGAAPACGVLVRLFLGRRCEYRVRYSAASRMQSKNRSAGAQASVGKSLIFAKRSVRAEQRAPLAFQRQRMGSSRLVMQRGSTHMRAHLGCNMRHCDFLMNQAKQASKDACFAYSRIMPSIRSGFSRKLRVTR